MTLVLKNWDHPFMLGGIGNSLLNKGVYLDRMQHFGARIGSILELDFTTKKI